MSLTTPDSIRTLQRKLYLKAKAEPGYRFYLLYDKIYRPDILLHAYDLVRANKGAPGVDGVTCAAIEAAGAGADMLLLDNMSVADMKETVARLRGKVRFEASGGVNLENVRAVAETGVDIISIGALTHSVKALDFSLEMG